MVSGGGGGEPPLGCVGGVAGVQGHGGGGAIGPGGGEGKLHGRGCGLGAGGCALGLGAAVEREPAAGEQLKAIGPPAAGDEGLLLAARAAEEQLGGTVGLPGFEKDPGEPDGRPGRDEAFVEVAREVGALLCGGQRGVEVAGGDRDDGAVEQVPRQGLRLAQQAGRLDRAVQQLGGLVQLAAHVPGPAQDLVQDKEELLLPGRARESQGTGGVRVGFGVAVEVELRGSEPGRRVEAARELVYRRGCQPGTRRRPGRTAPVRPPRSWRRRARASRARPPSGAGLRALFAALTARWAQSYIEWYFER